MNESSAKLVRLWVSAHGNTNYWIFHEVNQGLTEVRFVHVGYPQAELVVVERTAEAQRCLAEGRKVLFLPWAGEKIEESDDLKVFDGHTMGELQKELLSLRAA
jgi:hypothetical protein